MNLSIQNPDALESRIKKNEVLWKLTSRPPLRTSIVLMLLGAAILYFDISTHYTIMKLSTPKAIIYDLHLSFSIGLALLLLGLLLLFSLTFNKQSLFRTLEKIINRHRLNSRCPMVDFIEINDAGVTETT
jgi:hypothetical protein